MDGWWSGLQKEGLGGTVERMTVMAENEIIKDGLCGFEGERGTVLRR